MKILLACLIAILSTSILKADELTANFIVRQYCTDRLIHEWRATAIEDIENSVIKVKTVDGATIWVSGNILIEVIPEEEQ